MTWNVWPHSRLEAAKCVVPFCTLYTPAKQTSQLQVWAGPGLLRAWSVSGAAGQWSQLLLLLLLFFAAAGRQAYLGCCAAAAARSVQAA